MTRIIRPETPRTSPSSSPPASRAAARTACGRALRVGLRREERQPGPAHRAPGPRQQDVAYVLELRVLRVRVDVLGMAEHLLRALDRHRRGDGGAPGVEPARLQRPHRDRRDRGTALRPLGHLRLRERAGFARAVSAGLPGQSSSLPSVVLLTDFGVGDGVGDGVVEPDAMGVPVPPPPQAARVRASEAAAFSEIRARPRRSPSPPRSASARGPRPPCRSSRRSTAP